MLWLGCRKSALQKVARSNTPRHESGELPTSRIQAAFNPTRPRGQDQDVFVCEQSIFKHRVFGFLQKKMKICCVTSDQWFHQPSADSGTYCSIEAFSAYAKS